MGCGGGEGGRLDTEGPFGNSVDVCRLVLKVLILPKTKTYKKFSVLQSDGLLLLEISSIDKIS